MYFEIVNSIIFEICLCINKHPKHTLYDYLLCKTYLLVGFIIILVLLYVLVGTPVLLTDNTAKLSSLRVVSIAPDDSVLNPGGVGFGSPESTHASEEK